jgi:hypothetical protein
VADNVREKEFPLTAVTPGLPDTQGYRRSLPMCKRWPYHVCWALHFMHFALPPYTYGGITKWEEVVLLVLQYGGEGIRC